MSHFFSHSFALPSLRLGRLETSRASAHQFSILPCQRMALLAACSLPVATTRLVVVCCWFMVDPTPLIGSLSALRAAYPNNDASREAGRSTCLRSGVGRRLSCARQEPAVHQD